MYKTTFKLHNDCDQRISVLLYLENMSLIASEKNATV